MAVQDWRGTVIIRDDLAGSGGGEGTPTRIVAADPLTVTGAGSAASPYVIGLDVSEDDGNALTVGEDGGLYVPVPAAARWADASADADTLFVDAAAANNANMQCFAVDSVNGHVYVGGIMADGIQLDDEPAPLTYDERNSAGDMCFSRMSMNGAYLDQMYVRGVGHVVQFGVDAGGGGVPNLWSGTDIDLSTGNVQSTGVGYFPYAPSDTTALDNADITRFQPTGGPVDWSYCNVDPVANRLVTIREDAGYTWTYSLYPLTEAYQNVWNPVSEFTHVIRNRQQGVAAAGAYVYSWFGYGTGDDPGGATVVMYRFDATTGEILQAAPVDALYGQVGHREPEGVAVWLDDPDDTTSWRLGAGFGTTLDGAWTQSIVSWPATDHADSGAVPALNDVCLVSSTTTTGMVVGAPSVTTTATNGTLTAYCQDAGDVSVVDNGDTSFLVHKNGNIISYGNHLMAAGLTVGSTRVEDLGGGTGVLGIADADVPPATATGTGVIAYGQAGVLTLLQGDGTTLAVTPSTDSGNQLALGTDNGLYVPGVAAVEPVDATTATAAEIAGRLNELIAALTEVGLMARPGNTG